MNPSKDELQDLSETASRNGLVLTSCDEPNVGSVARLAWPKVETLPPAAGQGAEEVCPRCAILKGTPPVVSRCRQDIRLRLCASCSATSSTPASPPSVMLQSFSEETCRTTIRVATGRTYDVYNVQPA